MAHCVSPKPPNGCSNKISFLSSFLLGRKQPLCCLRPFCFSTFFCQVCYRFLKSQREKCRLIRRDSPKKRKITDNLCNISILHKVFTAFLSPAFILLFKRKVHCEKGQRFCCETYLLYYRGKRKTRNCAFAELYSPCFIYNIRAPPACDLFVQ